MEDLLIYVGAWFIAGVVNHIAGLGAAMVAMPIVVPFIPLSVAVPSSTLIVLSINLQLGWNFRQYIQWPDLRYIFFGGIAGTVAGVYLISSLPNETLKMLMAVFLICYAFYALFLEKGGPGGIDSRWGVLAGSLSTFFGSAFGFNGPPLAVYTAMSGWTADAAKGTLGACFILTGFAILSGQMAAGLQNMQTLAYFLAAGPAALAGGWVGIRCSRNFKKETSRKVLLALILFAGSSIFYSCI
ncbi:MULTISPECIES: sulfite exporter TauE/SafE family protein [unclassified Maridesulfovibrio]|uniref:sulfite exporter TauE/SafE family protein n=1 Tax=unclassified Maridesulfovibrio TaxID=2794999 RepID=UPI003B40B673